MITMKQIAERFKPVLKNVEDKKKTTETGIKIPYPDLARICVEFTPGECYSFFGSEKENALSIWRINLLWQLAKAGVPIHVLEGGKEFDKDFAELLCLQAGVETHHLKSGFFISKELETLLDTLDKIADYPITWHADLAVPLEDKTSVCVKTVSLEEWQRGELWNETAKRNKVLFLFVNIPEKTPIDWGHLYASNAIILPEELSSYMGFVRWIKPLDSALGVPQQELIVKIRQPDFLQPGYCGFSYDFGTGRIEPN